MNDSIEDIKCTQCECGNCAKCFESSRAVLIRQEPEHDMVDQETQKNESSEIEASSKEEK